MRPKVQGQQSESVLSTSMYKGRMSKVPNEKGRKKLTKGRRNAGTRFMPADTLPSPSSILGHQLRDDNLEEGRQSPTLIYSNQTPKNKRHLRKKLKIRDLKHIKQGPHCSLRHPRANLTPPDHKTLRPE